jgi:Rrf2 family protein
MLDLALHEEEAPVQVKDISERTGVSDRYLEQLLTPLRIAGLVKATRGSHGGFALAYPPSEIKVSHIMQAMEGSMAPTDCVDHSDICSRADTCATRQIWGEIKDAIDAILESTTLKDLVQRQKALQTDSDACEVAPPVWET